MIHDLAEASSATDTLASVDTSLIDYKSTDDSEVFVQMLGSGSRGLETLRPALELPIKDRSENKSTPFVPGEKGAGARCVDSAARRERDASITFSAQFE